MDNTSHSDVRAVKDQLEHHVVLWALPVPSSSKVEVPHVGPGKLMGGPYGAASDSFFFSDNNGQCRHMQQV